MKTIRLIYPQWQGGNIARWIPNIPENDSSRGYYLGAMLLEFLAPKTDIETYTVPVSTDMSERVESDGVLDRDIIAEQTKAALDSLTIANPDKVVTLGGECSVSVPVFTYLTNKYNGDVAIVWVDAHPDITLPEDDYNGYHAMALTACMGMGDKKIVGQLPGKVGPQNVCIAGVRDVEYPYIKERVEKLGITHFSPEELANNSQSVIDWLCKSGKSKVMVHFDMDVMDPADILAAVADGPEGGMKLKEVVRLINDIATEKELVALTVAEPMPRLAIRLKAMLANLPLLS
ncbi:MAG: arginase family protein [Pseudoflavonifractor sp.]|nr:arginase family protein [Pseudoflavonifractor sp.]